MEDDNGGSSWYIKAILRKIALEINRRIR